VTQSFDDLTVQEIVDRFERTFGREMTSSEKDGLFFLGEEIPPPTPLKFRVKLVLPPKKS
jgi:hypothetical protein